jgi:hypothetical protein
MAPAPARDSKEFLELTAYLENAAECVDKRAITLEQALEGAMVRGMWEGWKARGEQ